MLRRRLLAALVVAAFAVPVGAWRLERLDGGAAKLQPGMAAFAGTVSIGPRRFGSDVLFTLDAAIGRIAVRAGAGLGPVVTGDRVAVRGEVVPAGDWIAGYLRRLGARSWLIARRITVVGRRGGLTGVLDGIRIRASEAIDASMPEREAALMRGFVLGDDSQIDALMTEDFKTSGLAHLLAVSGQNVVLLLVFGSAILIALGVPLRRRWPILAAAVAIYVPVAGAGPSIQRAGIMGVVGLLAASLERPVDRGWCLYLAAAATLAWNPLAIADAGWQLSFAAVAGIALMARPLAAWLRRRLGRIEATTVRAALADGAAITAAATLATAPLMAHHFESVSLAALPANLLALPAVAAAMWAGMAIGLAGQLPGIPLEPLGALAAWLAGYIEWVASVTAQPSWALVELRLGSWSLVAGVYLLFGSLVLYGRSIAERLTAFSAERPSQPAPRNLPGRSLGARLGGLAAVSVLVVVALLTRGGSPVVDPAGPWRFETRFLDVGQGDSILLREREGAAVLLDTGYAGTGAEDRLAELGVERLDALILSHADSDHAGNLEGIAAGLPVGAVYTNGLDRRLGARVRALGLRERVVAAGDRLRFGRIRLDVVWPPPGLLGPGAEPNGSAIVAVAGWRRFSGLLTADAEAEVTGYAPPDVNVLKVPHHGSADAELDGLLTASRPELAVISVGDENTYGHPTAESVGAVARAGVPLLRTDTDGEIQVAVTRTAWTVSG